MNAVIVLVTSSLHSFRMSSDKKAERIQSERVLGHKTNKWSENEEEGMAVASEASALLLCFKTFL